MNGKYTENCFICSGGNGNVNRIGMEWIQWSLCIQNDEISQNSNWVMEQTAARKR